MKKRYSYLILFGIPGLVISSILAGFVFLLSMGVSWLFIFGDNPWPENIFTIFTFVSTIAFLISWTSILIYGFRFGKAKEEINEPFNKNHIVLSVIISFLIIFFIAGRLLLSGFFIKDEMDLCMDSCSLNGYGGASRAPKSLEDPELICFCYDDVKKEKIPNPL